jgi:hypothetical protein
MAWRIATAVRNTMLDAIDDALAAGTAAPKLRIYSGSPPAGPGSAATGTLLAEFTLNDPAFDAAGSGAMSLDIDPAVATTGLAAGTAGWGRLLTSNEAAGTGLGVADGVVGTEITLNTTTVSVGVALTASGSINIPAS